MRQRRLKLDWLRAGALAVPIRRPGRPESERSFAGRGAPAREFTERTHKRRPDKPELRRGAQDTCGFRASDTHGQPFKKLPLDDSFTATSSTHVFLLRFRFLSKMN